MSQVVFVIGILFYTFVDRIAAPIRSFWLNPDSEKGQDLDPDNAQSRSVFIDFNDF